MEKRLTIIDNTIEAHMFKNYLENEGIECFLTNETFNTLMPGFYNMMGSGVQVFVQEEDYDKAKKLMEQYYKKETLECPYCHSKNVVPSIGKNKFGKILSILLSIIALVPFNNIKNTYRCKDCGKYFDKM